MISTHPNAPKPGLGRFLRILFRTTIFIAAAFSVTVTLLAGIMHVVTQLEPLTDGVEAVPRLIQIGSLATLVFFVFAGVGFCCGWCWAVYHATVNRSTAIAAYAAGGLIGGLALLLSAQIGAWTSSCVISLSLCEVPEFSFRSEFVLIASLIAFVLIAIARLSIGRAFRYFTWPID